MPSDEEHFAAVPSVLSGATGQDDAACDNEARTCNVCDDSLAADISRYSCANLQPLHEQADGYANKVSYCGERARCSSAALLLFL